MGFKENMIHEAEVAINSKRERRAQLEDELSTIDTEMEEARAILQLLRTGKVTPQNDHKRNVTTVEEYQDAFRVLGENGKTFVAADLAELLNITKNAAYAAVARFVENDFLIKISERNGATGARFILTQED